MPAEQEPQRMVHLGLGAFMRAFGIPWIAEADPQMQVIGVTMRNRDLRDALARNDFAYHSVEQGADGTRVAPITSLSDVLVAQDDPHAVAEAMADPRTSLVTLTITEKGYCHDPSTWRLNADHADLASPTNALSLILKALRLRSDQGGGPITILSCDNLPNNGHVLKSVLMDFAQLKDPDLVDWIERNVAFPSSMVDRIVPATTSEKVARLKADHGIDDPAAVFHEPFRQWVIEEDFAGPMPDLGSVGVTLTKDVAPYEHMKLRLLNGAHSALAYLGHIDGHATIADSVGSAPIRRFLRRLWSDTLIPSMVGPEGVDLVEYTAALESRFSNPETRHLTWQVGMDGTQKLPQRLTGPLQWHLEAGRVPQDLCITLAAWVKYVSGRTCGGQPIDVSDPMADALAQAHAGARDTEDAVARVLGLLDGIGPQAEAILPNVVGFYRSIEDHGVQATLEATFQ